MNSSVTNSNILILEDDPDQMEMLVDFALDELAKLAADENISDEQRQKVEDIRLIKVSNIQSLQKSASMHKDVLLALLDCNTPDTEGSAPNDQLVKTNHSITGQHRAVDIVTHYLPDTPITLMSSLDRFRRLVNRYYANKHNLSIRFVGKSDQLGIKENIQFYLKEYLASVD